MYLQEERHTFTPVLRNWEYSHGRKPKQKLTQPSVRRYVDAVCRHNAASCHPHFLRTVVHHITPRQTQQRNQKVKGLAGERRVVCGIEAVRSHCDYVIYAAKARRLRLKEKKKIYVSSHGVYLWSRGRVMVIRCSSVFSSTKRNISTWLLY